MTCSRSLKHDIDDLAALVFPSLRLAVVDDANTARALGDQVFRALKGRFSDTHITLERSARADQETVDHIRRRAGTCDALVAVGSGTVSDLCKYASFLDNKPYIVFPTAASMNGYVSANASITLEGYKKTLKAHMPKAVCCDLSVIAAAPGRLGKSGLGDALARPTAQADWLLSHLLLNTPYNELPFTLLRPLEHALFENARGIAMGDRQSIELLLQTLLLSGFGMTIAGGGYPASQGEHMIAHAHHMLFHSPAGDVITLHGEEIGITTLTMARRQEKRLRGRPSLKPQVFPEEEIASHFGFVIAHEAKKSYAAKCEIIRQAGLSNETLAQKWESVVERIAPLMIPPARIEAILDAAEAPSSPPALGWPQKSYDTAIAYAGFLRERFTFLDLQ
ncbi:MAG: iron-containing alcohol dehydrogenase [Pseudomonadota bacterium]|nr:iron-containing alcohol dehydrogenase [Pseudomonadota bacterium]